MTDILTFEELKKASGYKRVGDVLRFLRSHGIPYYLGKGGYPVTTQTQFNASLSGESIKHTVEIA